MAMTGILRPGHVQLRFQRNDPSPQILGDSRQCLILIGQGLLGGGVHPHH